MNHVLSEAAIADVICSLVEDELSALRSQQEGIKISIHENTRFTLTSLITDSSNEVAVDSFEWIAIASRVINYFDVEKSGLEDYFLRKRSIRDWAEIVMKSRALSSTTLRMRTSGSAGAAQIFEHEYSDLLNEVRFFSDYINRQKVSIDRIIAVVPSHHIYGFLFSVLLPDILGVTVLRGMRAHSEVHKGLLPNDLLVAFPSFLNLVSQRRIFFSQQVCVLSSTGPCSFDTIRALRAQGLEYFVEIYGSTDTGGVGIRTDESEPFKLLPRWQRTLKGELKSTFIIDTTHQSHVELPDELQWTPNDSTEYFLPVGRKDFAVSIHGVNVFPLRVAEVIRRCELVEDARVRLREDGNGLTALIIPSDNRNEGSLLKAIIKYAEAALSKAEQPKDYFFATTIPTNGFGKEVDWSKDESL